MTCTKCDGTGYVYAQHDGTEVMRHCECWGRHQRGLKLASAGIPKHLADCTLDSWELWDEANATLKTAHREVTTYTENYPNTPKPGLLLMGPVGTGKTHLAAAALTELILAGRVREGRFVDFPSLSTEMKMTFGSTGESRELLQPLAQAPLLVLDELGAGKGSEWSLELLYYLINRRYLDELPTICTSNLPDPGGKAAGDHLADRVTRRVRSRLFEMCTKVELRGADYRKHAYAGRTERLA